jgi:ABC-type xylose transport system substrate-binding protein
VNVKGINVERTLAWLMRNEGVPADAIERAVTSAHNMQLGESVTLSGTDDAQATLRRVFVQEQVRRIAK